MLEVARHALKYGMFAAIAPAASGCDPARFVLRQQLGRRAQPRLVFKSLKSGDPAVSV
jgi:hypothetical protein